MSRCFAPDLQDAISPADDAGRPGEEEAHRAILVGPNLEVRCDGVAVSPAFRFRDFHGALPLFVDDFESGGAAGWTLAAN